MTGGILFWRADLLKFSRAHKRTEAVVDLNSVIKETIALMPPRFLTDKISIRCDLSTVSPKITGDADKLLPASFK